MITNHVRYPILFGVVTLLLGCNRVVTVDEVIERNTAAMGGRAAIEAVHSIEVNLHITDPGFEVDGVYYAARPGKMRIDVSVAGKHVFTEAFDGQRLGMERKGIEACLGKGNSCATTRSRASGKAFRPA